MSDQPLPRLGDKTGQPIEITEDNEPVSFVCWRCKNPAPTDREFCPASEIGAPCMGTRVGIQACRPGDRAILQTEAGRELVAAAVAQMQPAHIPGPWMVEPINSGETYQITTSESRRFTVVAETPVDPTGRCGANARRIVACVNALESLSIEQIEDDAFVKMRTDRDELLARIKTVRDDLAEAIDGGDELRNYDQWISRLIRTLDGEAP